MTRREAVEAYLHRASASALSQHVISAEWRGRSKIRDAFPEGEALEHLRLRNPRWTPTASDRYYAALRLALKEADRQSVSGELHIMYRDGDHRLQEDLPIQARTPREAARAAYGVARRRLHDFLGTRY